MENETHEVAQLAPAEEQPNDALSAPTDGAEFIKSLPLAVRSLFEKPPLLHHEDRNQYDALQKAVEAAIQPRDLVEFLWVRDFTDLTWEIERNRRLRTAVLEEAEREAVRAIFRVRVNDGKREDPRALDAIAAQWTQKWYDFEPGTDNIEKDQIVGVAFRLRSKEIDQLEKQIAACESRRNKVLREMESRRDRLEARSQLIQLARRAQEFFNSQTAGVTVEEFAMQRSRRRAHLLPTRKGPTRRPRKRTGTDQE